MIERPDNTTNIILTPNELESIKKEYYNKGIDTAISLVKDCMDYDMTGMGEVILCGLDNSKKV